MQRQSLGSPGSKQAATASGSLAGGAPDSADETKAEKLIRSSSSRSSRTTVHLIPILTVVCFLILYLISHEPSPIDLPITRGIERIIEPKAVSVSGFVSAAIRTKRGLMEEKKRIRTSNRRIGQQ